jgi:hypothetical protein
MLNETDRGTTTTLNPVVDATPAVASPAAPPPPVARRTRSGRRVRFPARFNIRATISAGGGVMWEPPTLNQALADQR